jgi:protein-arginine kinase activator protein McsA
MTIKHRYREFVKDHEKLLEDYKQQANEFGGPAEKAIASIFKKLAYKMYPLTIEEWLNKELYESIEKEDFEYASQVKQEIEQL